MKYRFVYAPIFLILLLGICGCSSSPVHGIYTQSSSVFGGESIHLNDDGTFTYSLWSDDRDEECQTHGTWEVNEAKPTTVVTQVKTVDPAHFGDHCENQPRIETWTVGSRSLIRLVDSKYKVSFQKVNDDVK